MILDFLKKKKSLEEKKKEIKYFVYKYYKDCSTEIPYFMLAEKWMKEHIQSLADVNFYYDLIQMKKRGYYDV